MRILAIGLTVALLTGSLRAAGPTTKPNILFILADDMGWADVGYHGGEVKTPNIDKLAAAGVKLESFYVQPVCSPTRASLMTGRYPMRYGLQTGVVRPWAQYGVPLEERFLPVALKEAGYETAICGKWHLGHFEPAYLPTHRGFDHQYGHYNGAIDYFTHERDGGLDWHRDDKALHEEGYSTTLVGNEAARLIKEHDSSKPLFLYVPFNAVHAPYEVPGEDKSQYSSMPEKRRTYAAMCTVMDQSIGTILDALDQSPLKDNTLIIFCNDNGGPAPGRITSNGSLRAGKGTLYEGGTRVSCCAVWQNHIKPGTTVTAPLHMVDWFPTLLKLAGATLEQKLPLDGKDAWATIAEGAPSPNAEILLNSTPMNGAIRIGDWKLIINGQKSEIDEGGRDENAPQETPAQRRARRRVGGGEELIELFNIANDPDEKKNLAEANPDKVKELRARYDALAAQAVKPKLEPKAPGFKSPKIWGEAD